MREFILAFAVRHDCDPNPRSETRTCGTDHRSRDLIEIPSAIFIEATNATRTKPNGEPIAPD